MYTNDCHVIDKASEQELHHIIPITLTVVGRYNIILGVRSGHIIHSLNCGSDFYFALALTYTNCQSQPMPTDCWKQSGSLTKSYSTK